MLGQDYVDRADKIDPNVLSISTSPSIISLVIGDVMGLVGLAEENNENLLWFDNQQAFSNLLVQITFISLPVMLCAIPCLQICCPKSHEPSEEYDYIEGGTPGTHTHEDQGIELAQMGNGMKVQ